MDIKSRNFQTDFCLPAIDGLKRSAAIKVGKALDVAILFGVLEYLDGNESIAGMPREQMEALYWERVTALKKL